MNKKEKAIFRIFLMLGGLAMMIDGICWIITLGFYSPSLCIKLAKARTNWMLEVLKSRR